MDLVFCLQHLDTYISSLVWAAIEKNISTVIQVPETLDHPWNDHCISVDQFFRPKNIDLCPYEAVSANTYVFQLDHFPGLSPRSVNSIIESSRSSKRTITLYNATFGSFRQRTLQQYRSIRSCPGLLASIGELKYYGGFGKFDIFSALRITRSPTTIGPNLTVYDLSYRTNLISAWDPYQSRNGIFCFFGNLAGQRQNLLEAISLKRNEFPAIYFCNKISLLMALSGEFPFLVGAGLRPEEYPLAMTNWDFCLCLPGSNTWAHRSFESGMRGTIPILGVKELPYLGGLLESGDNCITVADTNDPVQWAEAIRFAHSLSQNKIIRMRESLLHKFQGPREDLSGYLLKGAGIL